MKVKVDSCVYDVNYISIEKMKVTYTTRSHFQIEKNLSECELLSENFIDDLAIEHVKNVMDAKEKTKDSLSDAEFASDIMNNAMNKMDNAKLSDFKFKKQQEKLSINFKRLSESLSDNNDMVNNPKHYQIGLGEYEMKDVSYALIDHNKLDGREGAVYFNVLKYIGRFNNKGVPIQDLEKAKFYLKELIELTKEKDY